MTCISATPPAACSRAVIKSESSSSGSSVPAQRNAGGRRQSDQAVHADIPVRNGEAANLEVVTVAAACGQRAHGRIVHHHVGDRERLLVLDQLRRVVGGAERHVHQIGDAEDPQVAAARQDGDLVQGSGGVRKIRFAGSGGYRVMVAYLGDDGPAYLLGVLSKTARANFTDAEINAMHSLTKAIKQARKAARDR